ncbi:MAG: hypothetical protein WCP93_00250 [Candidatus Berkelbacteria bacterium]
MLNDQWLLRGKLILAAILAVSVYGFFYFETSIILKVLVVVIAGVSFYMGIRHEAEKPPLTSHREFLILFVLYLAVFTLYNLLYGLGIQLYLIMIAVWLLVTLLFLCMLILDKIDTLMRRALFWLFASLNGLVVLEVFLSLAFWPVDPKIKSLILVVVFYLITNLIYLYTHNVLRFKKVLGYFVVSVLILGLLILSTWLGFKGGQ